MEIFKTFATQNDVCYEGVPLDRIQDLRNDKRRTYSYTSTVHQSPMFKGLNPHVNPWNTGGDKTNQKCKHNFSI